jgi:elongation factor P
MSVIATNLRKGMAVRHNGAVCVVESVTHRTPGNLRAFIQAAMRTVETGKGFEHRFASNDSIETVNLDTQQWEFNYEDQDGYIFMNPETFESLHFSKEMVGETKYYLKENIACNVLFIEGRAVSIEAPSHVELKVTYSPEGVKGNSANNVMKSAKVETGLEVNVPLFIKEGEIIRIDTRTGEYVSRA